MDDQNTQNPQGTGANPAGATPAQGDATLPWMNFSPDGAGMQASSGGQTAASDGTFNPSAIPADNSALSGGSFDPFGNPFATPTTAEDTAAAFAPSTQDGSLQSPAETTFTGGFAPSEPSAFTPTFEEATPAVAAAPEATPAVAEEAAPSWMNETPAFTEAASTMETDEGDALAMLSAFKSNFEEEEEDFNKQVEEHNLNIQYEKDAIGKLRAERSERLSQMREIVRGLDDLLGMRKSGGNERNDAKNTDNRNGARNRSEEPRKAERMAPKKQDRPKAADDFLAA